MFSGVRKGKIVEMRLFAVFVTAVCVLFLINQFIRGAQRFVSGNICSEGLKSPEIFGFSCGES